jgi:hypothetical protein
MPTTRAFSSSVAQVKEKVKAAAATARALNSVDSDPWGPAPDWQASTSYFAGSIVKANGYLYLMFGNSSSGAGVAGTSGASTPFNANPFSSGQDVGLISDNTCRWLYYGVARSVGSRPLVSTVTPAASSDVMDGYLAIVAASAMSTIGLTRVIDVTATQTANDRLFWMTGGPFAIEGGHPLIQGPNNATAASPSYPDSLRRPVVDMVTDARWIAFQGAGPMYAGTPFLIEVNGRLLSPAAFRVPSLASNSCLLIDLSTFNGEKSVRIYGYQNIRSTLTYLVYVGPRDSVRAPKNPMRFGLAFDGDSITQGSYSSPINPGLGVDVLTARRIGCDHFYNNAIGGTGFLANSSGTKTTLAERLDRISSFNPDILVLGGNHNDAVGTYSSAQRQAAVVSYLQAARAALPRCAFFVTGGHLLQSESATGANQLTLEADMSAAVTTFGDVNTVFVPVLTDPAGAWTSGTGTGNSPQSNGNKDRFYWKIASVFTDSHPIPPFYDMLSARLANAIWSWANS